MSLATILKFRIPPDLQTRLDETAARTARTRSDVTRESIVIGLAQITRRYANDDDLPPRAA